MQVGSDYGIDWDGPTSMTDNEIGITIERIDCPLSSDDLAVVEEHFNINYILSTEHIGADRYTELLETVEDLTN